MVETEALQEATPMQMMYKGIRMYFSFYNNRKHHFKKKGSDGLKPDMTVSMASTGGTAHGGGCVHEESPNPYLRPRVFHYNCALHFHTYGGLIDHSQIVPILLLVLLLEHVVAHDRNRGPSGAEGIFQAR
jgi:hypothetical protein